MSSYVKIQMSIKLCLDNTGDMWAQEWGALIDDVLPYPNSAKVDVTNALKEQVLRMHICIPIVSKLPF